MYRVLLVDDEPLILSGIKFMIDWNEYNCEIIGSVRNGQKALEVLRAQHPDIVICDISMPVLSGIELLEKANIESPETVFIMLTNHPDFDYAKHSLQNRAVDYLLKSQLDSETLATSLTRACNERDKRQKLANATFLDDYQQNNEAELLNSTLSFIMHTPSGSKMDHAAQLLSAKHVLEQYAVIYIPVEYQVPSSTEESSKQDFSQLHSWHREIIEKIAENTFEQYTIFPFVEEPHSDFLFCWQLDPAQWDEQLSVFKEKLTSASNTITHLPFQVFSTPIFESKEQIEDLVHHVSSLCTAYYLGISISDISQALSIKPQFLGLSGLGERLATELRAQHASGCASVLDRAVRQISKYPHKKHQALWFCRELSDLVNSALGPGRISYSQDIESLTTRSQVIRWIEEVKQDLSSFLAPSVSNKTEFLEKARQYVRDNVDARIMLQDAADYANISPGYLSSLHNKVYNQKFVDYIHQVKMERACQMIMEGRYRISEISYKLSFENPYYFTRIFKRYIGMTPREYQKSVFNDVSADVTELDNTSEDFSTTETN